MFINPSQPGAGTKAQPALDSDVQNTRVLTGICTQLRVQSQVMNIERNENWIISGLYMEVYVAIAPILHGADLVLVVVTPIIVLLFILLNS